MFDAAEQAVIDAVLEDDNLIRMWSHWLERGRSIVFRDFRDLMRGDTDLNARYLIHNGDIYTDISLEDIAKVLDLDPALIREVKPWGRKVHVQYLEISQHDAESSQRTRGHCLSLQQELVDEKDYLVQISDEHKEGALRKQLEAELKGPVWRALKLNPVGASIAQAGSGLPLARDGPLKPLFEKIHKERRSLLIASAVPPGDYGGSNSNPTYIVSGVNSR